MKKLFTIVAVAIVSLSFTSCRQDEEAADFASNNTTQEKSAYGKTVNTVKADSVKLSSRPVDPDPPVKDGTSW